MISADLSKPIPAPSSFSPKKINRPRRSASRFLLHLVLFALATAMLLPFVLVVSVSLTDADALAENGYSLLPSNFSTFAWEYIFKAPEQIYNAYAVTIFITVVGTLTGMLIMSLFAYVISRPDFSLGKPLSFFILIPMLFSGGLVPSYLLMTQILHLKDTVWALIIPGLVSPFMILIMRTYFKTSIPEEFIDAARIDGANNWQIFFQIVMPMSTTMLFALGTIFMLGYWNDWYQALLYIDRSQNLVPIQYLLYRIMTNVSFLQANQQLTGQPVPTQPIRMVLATLGMGPVVLAIVFFQRFFVRGLTIGGIKG